MVHLPVRKCYYVAKAGLVLFIVISLLSMIERWRGGKRTARAEDVDALEGDFERQVLADEARIVPGLGEGGDAARLEGAEKELGEESEKKLAMNVYLSDRIAYNRTLKVRRRRRRLTMKMESEQDYERQIRADEARIIPGLGEMGIGVFFRGKEKEIAEESVKTKAMNVYLSDRIPYNRSVGDHRNPACERVVYDAELPSVSVIIIFHNEPYSVVVRTVWSVINSARRDQPWYQRANFVDRETGRTMTLGYAGQDPNSPFVYLKEIILVDDNSTLPELKGKLSHYIRTRLPPGMIRILRLPERVGLTRARLAGARYATGEALVFLDAHCEGQPDWLRPLLQRMKDAPNSVVMPIIDVIEASSMYYSVNDPTFFQGLILARIRGARSARGDVLIFLDAHCEVAQDWLRPLIQRIREKRDTVLTPLIDVLDQTTFELETAEEFQVGGFNFLGHFTWIDVPEREKKRRGSEIGATWSPTMAGGLFAINREYYWELGAYDEQMTGWGGENLEMSFRIWQCGGTLETVPCSRVGHVFRSFHPYGLPANSDTHGINTARMAEVWMDDYKELFYLHRPDLRKNPKIGDVTHRKVLREKLQCKNFEWYLNHIYKEKFVPVRDAFGYGRFRNQASGLCLDTLQREADGSPLGVYPCHPTLQGTQYLCLSLDGTLRDEERCVQLALSRRANDDGEGKKLLMVNCDKKKPGHEWRYTPTKQLIHTESGLCLDSGFEGSADVIAVKCRTGAPTQRWEIDYNEHNQFRLEGDREPSEAELALEKLRGQRRISRSLLSYNESDNSGYDSGKLRRHMHKRKKHKKSKRHGKVKRAHGSTRTQTKNKFILKLIRTLMNGSEDHLEVDIHCKHRQLYPNNSFVRDIVTILNEKNIKVINNGRVFERNRVTDLGRDPATMRQKETKVLKKLDVGEEGINGGAKPVPVKIAMPQTEPQKVDNKENKPQPIAQWQTKKHKTLNQVPPVTAASGVNVASPATAQRDYNSPVINEDNKKIIIEDFVEVKPSAITSEPLQAVTTGHRSSSSRKRKRKHQQPELMERSFSTDDEELPPLPRPGAKPRMTTRPRYDDEPITETRRTPSSAEETQKSSQEAEGETSKRSRGDNNIDSSEPETSDRDSDWFVGSGTSGGEYVPNELLRSKSIRRSGGDTISTLRPVANVDENDNVVDTAKESKNQDDSQLNATMRAKHASRHGNSPLKVVMKSNLTFNLGNEFFKWRSSDDAADMLGALAIPLNTSNRVAPPLHAWVKPATAPLRVGATHEKEDDVLIAHGQHPMLTAERAPGSAADSDSSSSESDEPRGPTPGNAFY